MKIIYLKEMKMNIKNLLIWSISVGAIGFACILLYQSMQGDMEEMADAFSNMGAFSDAFGMSTLSIATLKGYFATEVGTVHGLGSAMFAAIISIGILSREEENHTGEFLYALPVSRTKVITAKGLCIISMLALFTVICAIWYIIGFIALGEEMPVSEFMAFMARQFIMNLEIGAIAFCISAVSSKNQMGLGLGISLMFYVYDLIGRVVPDLKDYLFIGPFSYANASEIFSGIKPSVSAFITGIVIIIFTSAAAYFIYSKRDLAS
ncbi:MAG: ABC transporter permease [Butyrivibrio sp.]|nr:ABC transporter permease [Butyrivibrio sp.]